jgi:alanine dehydrogenase
MRVGVPSEIKTHEYRVGLTPISVRELVHHGHKVLLQDNAGIGSGYSNEDYERVGGKIVATAKDVFDAAEMIVKVKEPLAPEIAMLRKGQLLFTYLHLAADKKQTEGLMASGCTAIAYETVTANDGSLPLLAPMSEVAGRMAVQVGAHCLEKEQGGRGMLLGGIPGVGVADVVIIGGGSVGANAARMAMGLEARVTVLDKSIPRLRELELQYGTTLNTIYSTVGALEQLLSKADLVIGAVLAPGAAAPKVVSREMIKLMPQGSVVVDVAIDQGGCFETSRPTSHDKPTYVEEGVIHYCVTNMPGAVPRTSTQGLSNATLPFVLALANKGWQQACRDDKHLLEGLNIHDGHVTYEAVGRDLDLAYKPAAETL